ncbi:coiled-coil domain-containing protein 39-like [Eucyclogobius newberryi]|uniref:coiled-coil domain-containing protein 39-like n=1 Tax=Eucyclogobius newberryi TaxID=166745 RepID=UPI003B5C1D06
MSYLLGTSNEEIGLVYSILDVSSTAHSLMANLDWDVHLALPNCNAQNRALIEELQNKNKQLMEVEEKLRKNKDVKQMQTADLKFLKQTLESAEAFYRAVAREEESEKHLTALAEREAGRLAQESSKLKNEVRTLDDRSNMTEIQISKVKQKLQDFKNQMNWNQQTMDAFLEESGHKDEDTMAIIKYRQQDEQTIKSLTLDIEKMTVEVKEKRKALDKEVTETLSTQIALDQTNDNMRQVHQETQQFIQQWEFTLKHMKQSDSEMNDCAKQLAAMNQQVREKNITIRENEQLLKAQQINNREIERKVLRAKQLDLEMHKELKAHEDNFNCLKDELSTCRNTLERTKWEVDAAKPRISRLKKEICDNDTKLTTVRARNKGLEEKLKRVTETALSEEEKAAQMERFLQEEEETIAELEKHLQKYTQELFNSNNKLQSLKGEEKKAHSQISRSKSTILKLENEQRNVERALLSQQITINQQEAEINALTAKLERLQGTRDAEEKETYDRKILELTVALEEKRKQAASQSSMLKKVEEDICSFRKKLDRCETQRSNLEEKVEELELLCKTNQKELNLCRSQKPQNKMEHNILKMEVKRKRDLLYDKSNSVKSLETQRLEFQRVMKVQEETIRFNKEVQAQELKFIEQERLELSVKLNEKLLKVDLTMKRFDVLTISMTGPEGEEPEVYYVIRAAQEKEDLKRNRNSLDAKIHKIERDNHALENTIYIFNCSNSLFRESLNRDKESIPEFSEKTKLEEQLKEAEATLTLKKMQVQGLEQDLEDMNSTFENLLQEESLEKEKVEGKTALVAKIKKEVASQQEKIDRAAKECSKLIRDIRSAKQSKGETFEEKDIRLKELKEFHRNIDKMLVEAMQKHPELRAALTMTFDQANLSLPSLASTPSSGSSRTKSGVAHSSVSLPSPSGSRARSSNSQLPTVNTVELGLNLPVVSRTPFAYGSLSSCSGSRKKR